MLLDRLDPIMYGLIRAGFSRKTGTHFFAAPQDLDALWARSARFLLQPLFLRSRLYATEICHRPTARPSGLTCFRRPDRLRGLLLIGLVRAIDLLTAQREASLG